jgi:hypothetical protein
MRTKHESGHLCSKGGTKCFGSVKRVKGLSKKYFTEAFKKRLAGNQQHTASGISLGRDNSLSDDDTAAAGYLTNNTKKIALKRSVFFADVPPPKPVRGGERVASTITLKPIGTITPNLGRNSNVLSINLQMRSAAK